MQIDSSIKIAFITGFMAAAGSASFAAFIWLAMRIWRKCNGSLLKPVARVAATSHEPDSQNKNLPQQNTFHATKKRQGAFFNERSRSIFSALTSIVPLFLFVGLMAYFQVINILEFVRVPGAATRRDMLDLILQCGNAALLIGFLFSMIVGTLNLIKWLINVDIEQSKRDSQ